MRCHEVQNHVSAYLDRMLDGAAHEKVSEHLAGCPACRERFAATRSIVGSLRALPSPVPPSDLFDRTIVALDREAEPEMTIITRRHYNLRPHYQGGLASIAGQVILDYEFKLIAYCVGLFVSFILFGGLLASVRPLMSLAPFESPSQVAIWIQPVESQVLGASFASVHSLPRISATGGLPDVASGASEWDSLVVIAQIDTDGRGSIVEVLNQPANAEAVGTLAVALNRPRAFIPAYATSGRPIPTRVVLILEHVDVVG